MKWYQSAQNPKAIEGLYKEVPNLDSLQLFGVTIDREGPRLSLRANLARFPDHPPVRWHKSFNTAQIQLDFSGIDSLKIEGWETVMSISIQLEQKDDNTIFVIVDGENFKMQMRCSSFRIAEIVGYMLSP